MAAPVLLQSAFGGMRRLEARDSLPKGAVWNLVDWIPHRLEAALRMRGAWTYASPVLTGGTSVDGICRTPPFGAGEFNVAVNSDGSVDRFVDASKTNIGTGYACLQNPIVHRAGTGWLVIFPNADGTTALKSWDGTTFGTAAGSPPAAIYGDTWLDRIILANGTAGAVRYPGRLWFGPAGNSANTWDTTYGFWDFDQPFLGIARIRNAILNFFQGKTTILLGTTPPTSTDTGDLREGGTWAAGLLDARSIAKYGDTVIWAGPEGVYQSDGITLKNLTADAGMETYWFDTLLSSYDCISGGIVHNTYICSITNAGAFVDCLCYDFVLGVWYRMSNIKAKCWMQLPGTEKIYFGLTNTNRVGSAYLLFHPDSEAVTDADGTNISPTLETAFYRNPRSPFSLQQWRFLYPSYDLRAGSTPTLTVAYATDPNATSYTSISPTLAATTKTKRARLPLNIRAAGISLKITQSGGAAENRFHSLEAEYEPLEASELEQ